MARFRLALTARTLLMDRRLPGFLAFLAILLTLPSLGAGLSLDDYFHRAILSGNARFRSFGYSGNMFRFLPNDPEKIARIIDLGGMPWWTYPGVRMELFHPLSIVTFQLDYWLWPDRPVLMHVQNLLWFGAVVLVVAFFYRRMFGPTWLAGAAALLFVLDDAHATTVGWVANRNSLVAVFFGVSSLILHDRWRREGWRSGMVLAPFLFAASLLSKEEGLTTCAYLFAYSLFIDPAGPRRGLSALVPYGVLVLVWRVVRSQLGFGVAETGLYIDPVTDPSRFARALMEHAPILLLGQWGFPPSDITFVLSSPQQRTFLTGFAVTFLGLLIFVLAPLLRRDRLARFWFTGMVLAVIPVSATNPGDRLLTFAGIGAFGLLAQFWGLVFGDSDQRPTSRWWRLPAIVLGAGFVFVHLVLAPIVLPIRSADPTGLRRMETSMRKLPLGPSVEEETVVIVNPPTSLQANYLLLLRGLDGLPIPKHLRVLATGYPSVTVRRTDERTLVIRPALGFLWFPTDRLYRSELRPMPVGHRVELTGITVEVTGLTDDGRPAEATFRFDAPLEDRSLRWICYQDGNFQFYTPPAIGESTELSLGGPSHRDR